MLSSVGRCPAEQSNQKAYVLSGPSPAGAGSQLSRGTVELLAYRSANPGVRSQPRDIGMRVLHLQVTSVVSLPGNVFQLYRQVEGADLPEAVVPLEAEILTSIAQVCRLRLRVALMLLLFVETRDTQVPFWCGGKSTGRWPSYLSCWLLQGQSGGMECLCGWEW